MIFWFILKEESLIVAVYRSNPECVETLSKLLKNIYIRIQNAES